MHEARNRERFSVSAWAGPLAFLLWLLHGLPSTHSPLGCLQGPPSVQSTFHNRR